MPSPSRRSAASQGLHWICLGVALCIGLFWWLRLVAPGTGWGDVGSFDLRSYFYPAYADFYGRVARGELPLWNPNALCGMPRLALPAIGFFYPPHLLFLLLPTHLAMAASSLLHLLGIGLGTLLFTRKAGLGVAAATLAALLFTLRGIVTDWVRWPYLLEAGAWLPLGAYAVLELAAAPRLRWIALLGAATGASWLASGPQATVFLFYAWASLLLVLLLARRSTPGHWLRSGSGFALALALGTLVGGVALLPSMELTGEATRSAGRLSTERMFPMGRPPLLDFAVTGRASSFGVVGLSLLGAALLTARQRGLAIWALALGVLAFLFALGPVTPFFEAYLRLPVINWFRGPYRLMFLADFGFAVAAGIALDALLRSEPRGRAAFAVRALPLLTAAVIGTALALGGLFPATLFAAGLAVVLLLRWRAHAPRALGAIAAGVILLAVLESFAAPPNRALLPYDRRSADSYARYADVFRKLAEEQGPWRSWPIPGPVAPHQRGEKVAALYGVRSVDDYEATALRRQAEYFTYLAEGSIHSRYVQQTFQGKLHHMVYRRHEPGPSLAARRRLLDLASVRYLLVPSGHVGVPILQEWMDAAALERRQLDSTELTLWENPAALPRAFVVYRALPAPPAEELLETLSSTDFDPFEASYLEVAPEQLRARKSRRRGHPARILRDEAERVEIQATLSEPGFLVLGDSFYPGWQARVDGEPTEILPANHLFRAVAVPAGEHRIRFDFRPRSVGWGIATSLAGTAALLLLAGAALRGRAR